MAYRYYAEELTTIPFKTLRRAMAASVPGPLAFGLAAFLRLRGLLRWRFNWAMETGLLRWLNTSEVTRLRELRLP